MSEPEAYELKLSGSGLAELMQFVLDKGASFRFRARGFSMNPFIRDKDVLTVSRKTIHETDVGDVVAVICPATGYVIVHRIVRKSNQGVLIKGDNCSGADGLFPFDAVAGIITEVARNGRKVRYGRGSGKILIAIASRSGAFSGPLRPVLKRLYRFFQVTRILE